jgi:hypothetical protein
VLAAIVSVVLTTPGLALSISSEIERGFRFFKFNSDFELHRLAYKEFQNTHGGERPSVAQIDEILADLGWWYRDVSDKTAAWYGHNQAIQPIKLLQSWRQQEIKHDKRPPGYLELSAILHARQLADWEYHPVRLGWASLLFPAHQKPADLGNDNLVSAADVAVCWNRTAQSHSNCGGLNSYINPDGHTVTLRVVEASDVRLLDGQCEWSIDPVGGAKFVRPEAATAAAQWTAACSDDVAVFVPAGKEISIKLKRADDQTEATVKVPDRLIVGLGDSFSSGEGNPDVPAKLGWTSNQQRDWAADGKAIVDDVTNGPVRKAIGEYYAAQWIDRSCHRSAYSYQLRTALQLALEEPGAVTYLGYACSGAEVNEGLFHPFMGPEKTSSKASKSAAQKSQLPLLLNELCESYDGVKVLAAPLSAAQETKAISAKTYKFGGVIADQPYRCANAAAGQGFKRPIDQLYVSIGGNDLGFAKWIMAAITKEGQLGAFFPILGKPSDPACQNHQASCKETSQRWQALGARYALLRDFIDHRLDFGKRDTKPVLFYTYPLPVQQSNGELCPAGNAGLSVFLSATAPLPKVCLTRTQKDLAVLETVTAFADGKLNGTIEKLVSDRDEDGKARPGWLAVTEHRAKFAGRGFCASRVKELSSVAVAEEPYQGCKTVRQVDALVRELAPRLNGPAVQETLHLPVGVPSGDKEWSPFEPVNDYRPYHHRARLLRTMNETYFVINQLPNASAGNKASGALSLKDAAVFGAFHPTGEAHAIIADAFVKKSRELTPPD